MKFIELHEAAKMLRITPDTLLEMRSRNEVSAYRDGSTWKFKVQDIERLAQAKGLKAAKPESDEFDLDLADSSAEEDVELNLDDSGEADSILVSERELGQSDDTTSSTIIGKADPLAPSESDIRIGETDEEGSELRLADSASSVLPTEARKPGPSDTANLDAQSSGSGSLDFTTDDSEISLGGSDIASDASRASSSGFGSAIDLDLDDDELVLGSDVTAGAGDSGINLGNPSDSGLSLEEPLELGLGSSVESLELGEDDMLVVNDSADAESPTKLQADDDFLLSPVDLEAEEPDSGSQVIDLDSEEFDESAATMLAENATPRGSAAAVDFEAIDEDDAGLLAEVATPAAAAAAISPASRQIAEPQYSIWNVLSLFCIFCVLGLTGMMMLDLISNIWSWDKNLAFNSAIMDTILKMLGSSS
jgi:excisionase family DNA binding protein